MYTAYYSSKEIECCFYTVIIKNKALNKKYPGGSRVFLETHQGWCNEHLMAVFHFGDARKRALRELRMFGLHEGVDWIDLDEDKIVWSWDRCFFDTGVSWLRARYKKGNVFISLKAHKTEKS